MQWTTLTKDERFERKVEKYCKWHRWFAWHPIVIYNTDELKRNVVWLQFVGRKKKIVYISDERWAWLACRVHRYCYADQIVMMALRSPEIVDNSYGEYESLKTRLSEYRAGKSKEWQM